MNVIFFRNWRSGEMCVRNLTKVVGRRSQISVTPDEVRHHVKERLPVATVWIAQQEMQHPEN